MEYQIKFTSTGEQKLSVDNGSRAKIIVEALRASGLEPTCVRITPVVFPDPKKPKR